MISTRQLRDVEMAEPRNAVFTMWKLHRQRTLRQMTPTFRAASHFINLEVISKMAGDLRETSSKKIPQLFPDAIYHKLTPAPEHPLFNYNGFLPGRTVLPKGHVKSPGYRPFSKDVIFDRDVAIQVRDGAKLYADIFRPHDSDGKPVPVIIPWSPYGKTGTGPQNYDFMAPHRAGIPKDRTSGYEKFEVRNHTQHIDWPDQLIVLR